MRNGERERERGGGGGGGGLVTYHERLVFFDQSVHVFPRISHGSVQRYSREQGEKKVPHLPVEALVHSKAFFP